MEAYNIVYWLILALMLSSFVFEGYMEYLFYKSLSNPIPESLKNIYSPDNYQKHINYHRDLYHFSNMHDLFFFVISFSFVALKLPGQIDNYLRLLLHNEFLISLLFFLIIGFFYLLLSLPFSYYETFVIEEKYGFNKSTKKLFISDILKSIIISLTIGIPLYYAIFWFYQTTQEYFWLYAWLLLVVVSFLFTLLYSRVIVPLFNKQTPLEDGELKDAIMTFCKKVNFPLSDVYQIDASKRSTKANAYFTGLGKNKRIVLFDTLIKQLTTNEIVAVLAHEIGHYKHKHIIKSFVLSSIQMGITLFILNIFFKYSVFSFALGGKIHCFHLSLIAFGVLYSPISFVVSILFNYLSRKNEKQADSFVKKYQLHNELIEALKKLSSNNYSHLTPPDIYVKLFYSHPPLIKRIEYLES